MEIFLHLWDELDDVTAACRHVTASAMDEVAAVSRRSSSARGRPPSPLWLMRLPGLIRRRSAPLPLEISARSPKIARP